VFEIVSLETEEVIFDGLTLAQAINLLDQFREYDSYVILKEEKS
jgi:hypothetical protein